MRETSDFEPQKTHYRRVIKGVGGEKKPISLPTWMLIGKVK